MELRRRGTEQRFLRALHDPSEALNRPAGGKVHPRKLTEQEHKRVAILIPVLLRGGTEAQTLHLARALVADGYAVSVCCYYDADPVIVAEFEAAGASAERLALDRSVSSPSSLRLARLGWLLCQYLRKIRPDIAHVQYMAPGLVPIMAARLAGVRTILATVHQPGMVYGARARSLLRVASRLCSAFFCVSRAVEESWFGDSAVFDPADVGRRRHFTLYNCVDIERFTQGAIQADVQATRSELGLGGRSVVGVVGRLRQEKGHAVLLEAFSSVVRSIPDAALLVVGDGPDRGDLEARVQALGIGDRTVWVGERNPAELSRLYAAMDLVAVPSLFEGFGLVAVEAMAAGKPVVASATGGLMEIVVDGVTGTLVPAGNRAALAEAIVSLLKDPAGAAAMGRDARRIAKERFSLEAFACTVSSVYWCYAV